MNAPERPRPSAKRESVTPLGLQSCKHPTVAKARMVHIAEVHAWRGEDDLAFAWPDRAYAQRDAYMADIKLSPYLQRLAPDPRYKAFLKKVNLPE